VQLFLAANCNWIAADFNAAPHFAFGDGTFDLVILREHRTSPSHTKVAAGNPRYSVGCDLFVMKLQVVLQ
jgi:hypothetical protein